MMAHFARLVLNINVSLIFPLILFDTLKCNELNKINGKINE